VPGEGGQVKTLPFASGLGLLEPAAVAEILIMQERAFGKLGLTAPKESRRPV